MNKATKEAYIAAAEARIDAKCKQMCLDHGLRADAGEVVFTRGELEAVETEIFSVLFESDNLEAALHIPTVTGFDRGATSYTYYAETRTGEAKLMHGDDTTRPVNNASLASSTQALAEFGSGYEYSIQDGEQASTSGYNLTASKARSCAEAIARAMDSHALIGSTDFSVSTGFYDDAGVSSATLTDSNWTTVTAADMYATLNDVVNQVSEGSEGIFRATDLLVSLFIWNKIEQTRISTGTDTTVLQAFRANNPGVTVSLARSTKDKGGANVDRMVAYEKAADIARVIIPIAYDEAAPDKDGFIYRVQARGKTSGTVVLQPLGIAYGDVTIA